MFKKNYQTKNGIVLALENPSKTIINEINGWHKLAQDEAWIRPSQEYIQNLPNPPKHSIPKDDNFSWNKHAKEFFEDLQKLELKGKLVLDLAAGRCWTTKELVKRGATCVATDILTEYGTGLETGNDYPEQFVKVQCDMNNTPFVDECFDMVYSYASMHHTEDLQQTIDECHRVLKVGGLLVLSGEPRDSIYGPLARLVLYNKFISKYKINETIPHYLTWKKCIESAGFKIIKYPDKILYSMFRGGNMFLIAQKVKA